MGTDQRGLDLWLLARLFLRGRIVLALCALAGMLAFGYYAFAMATPTYRATTTVILETRREEIADLQAVVAGLTGDVTEINTEIEVLRGRVLMGRVADTLGLIADPEFNGALVPDGLRTRLKHWLRDLIPGAAPAPGGPDEERESVIGRLLSQVSVQAVPSSLVFRITVTSADPVKAATIADAIATIYIATQIEAKEAATAEAVDSLTGRVAELQAELERAETRVAELAAGSDGSEQSAGELAEARAALAAARDTADRLLARQMALTTAPTRPALAQIADDDLLRAALTRLTEAGGPAAFDARSAQVARGVAAEIAQARTDIAGLTAREAGLVDQIDAGQIARRELVQYQREADATRRLYEDFLTRLLETTSQQDLIQPDSRILSHAVVPNVHSDPRRSQLIVMGLIFGLVAGAALLLLQEKLVRTFRNTRDLAVQTGLRVLGQVPVIPAKGRAEVLAYLAERPTSVAAEAVRNLRTSLFVAADHAPPRVILVTSTLPDEGATTVAAALAQNLAAMGKSVVLVDGDLRRSPFEEMFGTGTGKGLMSVVSGDVVPEEAVFAVQPYDFDVLLGVTAGIPGVPDALSSDRFADLVALLSDTYDVVLIDSPPILIVPDARIIARLAQTVLYVVRADDTTQRQLAEGLRLLDGVGPRPPSLVLTRVDASRVADPATEAFGNLGAAYYRN